MCLYGQGLKEIQEFSCALAVVFSPKSWLTLCHPRDCGPPGSSVCEIFQARILERTAIAFSSSSSRPGISTSLLHCRWILHQLSHLGGLGCYCCLDF